MQFLIYRTAYNPTPVVAPDDLLMTPGVTKLNGSIVTVAALIAADDRTQAIERFERQNPRPQLKQKLEYALMEGFGHEKN